jgi:hypothetical protein
MLDERTVGRWTLHTRVVGTVDSTVLGASAAVRASSIVPSVAVEAVGVPAGDVGPSPVGVECNGTLLAGAALSTGTSASLPCHLGMCLRCLFANLLSAGGSEEREGSEGECPVHGDLLSESLLLDIEIFDG